jgi:Na+/phosphate symporter
MITLESLEERKQGLQQQQRETLRLLDIIEGGLQVIDKLIAEFDTPQIKEDIEHEVQD